MLSLEIYKIILHLQFICKFKSPTATSLLHNPNVINILKRHLSEARFIWSIVYLCPTQHYIARKTYLGSNFKDDEQIFSGGLSGGNYKDTPIKIQYYSSKNILNVELYPKSGAGWRVAPLTHLGCETSSGRHRYHIKYRGNKTHRTTHVYS